MDGQTIYIPRKDLDKIRQVNEQLTQETGLTIEETIYSKMGVRDVNNYFAVYEDSTKENEHIKLKGDYEIDKEYHKDPSMRIVPIAVKNYFVYGIPIEETIKNHNDIFDFCLRLKTNSSCKPYYEFINDEGKQEKLELNRTTRYYISNKGGALSKYFSDGRITRVNTGYVTTLFNVYEKKEMKDYNINYNFYLTEARKLINGIENRQLELF